MVRAVSVKSVRGKRRGGRVKKDIGSSTLVRNLDPKTIKRLKAPLCARMGETVPPSEITVEGGKGYSHGSAG